MYKWLKGLILLFFVFGSIIGFMIKLPSSFRHFDKELHTAFYFLAATFLNILFSGRNFAKHLLIFIGLLLFGVCIEYAQEYSNTFFHARIHGKFDTEDVKANLIGLIAFSIIWFIAFCISPTIKKKE